MDKTVNCIFVKGDKIYTEFLRPKGCSSSSARPCLVFLHEGLGSISQWKDFPKRICQATGLPALLYDRAGYGRSGASIDPWGFDYLYDEAVLVLPEIIRIFGVERVIPVGHSDGGSIGLIFASHHREKCTAIVTEAAHVRVEGITIEGIKKIVDRFCVDNTLRKSLERHHGEKAESVFYRWAERWLSPEFYHWNIEKYLSRIEAPLLAIQGETDEYATTLQLKSISSRVAGPVETLLIPECNHSPHFQCEEKIVEAVRIFIEASLS